MKSEKEIRDEIKKLETAINECIDYGDLVKGGYYAAKAFTLKWVLLGERDHRLETIIISAENNYYRLITR